MLIIINIVQSRGPEGTRTKLLLSRRFTTQILIIGENDKRGRIYDISASKNEIKEFQEQSLAHLVINLSDQKGHQKGLC